MRCANVKSLSWAGFRVRPLEVALAWLQLVITRWLQMRHQLNYLKLSIGIGPFVIAPAVERKMGVGALAELSLAAHEWKNAYWAKENGLYARVFESIKDLDKEIDVFTEKLASYNPEALLEMKKLMWKNTDHWEFII